MTTACTIAYITKQNRRQRKAHAFCVENVGDLLEIGRSERVPSEPLKNHFAVPEKSDGKMRQIFRTPAGWSKRSSCAATMREQSWRTFSTSCYGRRLGKSDASCNANPMSPLMRKRPDMATMVPLT